MYVYIYIYIYMYNWLGFKFGVVYLLCVDLM